MAVAALLAAFGQIALGGVVRTTGSGLGCPDWPLCHGRLIPPVEFATFVEYTHRLSASVLGILMVAAAVMAWLFYRRNRWIWRASVLGLALVIVASALGGATVLTDLSWWVRLVHLSVAEAVVACMVVVVLLAWRDSAPQVSDDRTATEDRRFRMLLLATIAGMFLVILSGSYMVGQQAGSACTTWPLCRGSLLPEGTPSTIHMAHRLLVAAVGILVMSTAVSAWSRRDRRRELGWAGLVLAVVFGAEVLAGAGTVWAGFTSQTKSLHLGLATLAWMASMVLATLVFTPQPPHLRRFVTGSEPSSEPEEATP